MDINVTDFLKTDHMRAYSASVAEIGPDAGASTWRASVEAAGLWNFLPDADALQEFREWLKPWGAWDDAEIGAMSDDHLRALCLQWIAGDWRDCFKSATWRDADWSDYENRASAGDCSGTFYRADDGTVFWTMTH